MSDGSARGTPRFACGFPLSVTSARVPPAIPLPPCARWLQINTLPPVFFFFLSISDRKSRNGEARPGLMGAARAGLRWAGRNPSLHSENKLASSTSNPK
jgi:hypothetical protein